MAPSLRLRAAELTWCGLISTHVYTQLNSFLLYTTSGVSSAVRGADRTLNPGPKQHSHCSLSHCGNWAHCEIDCRDYRLSIFCVHRPYGEWCVRGLLSIDRSLLETQCHLLSLAWLNREQIYSLSVLRQMYWALFYVLPFVGNWPVSFFQLLLGGCSLLLVYNEINNCRGLLQNLLTAPSLLIWSLCLRPEL